MQLLHELAGELPDSGRGIMVLAYLGGWQFRKSLTGAVLDATFSRFRANSTQTMGGDVHLARRHAVRPEGCNHPA